MSKHRDRRPQRTTRSFGAIGTSSPYPCLLDHSLQTDEDKKHRVSPLACPDSGPHSSARVRANLSGDDYTPHSVRKNTEHSAKFMSLNGEHILTWWVRYLVAWTDLLQNPRRQRVFCPFDNSCL